MKLNAVLGGITAVMLTGTFCTFSMCMVENAEDITIPSEYYFVEETSDDKLSAELAPEGNAPQETVPLEEETAEEDTADGVITENIGYESDDDGFDEEAVQVAVVTAVPDFFGNKDPVPAAPSEDTYYDTDTEDYPVDYDVDDYDEGDSEAVEQTVYGNNEIGQDRLFDNEETENYSVMEQDTVTEEIFADPYTDDDDYDDIVVEPMFEDDIPDMPKEDIVITVFEDDNRYTAPEETSVSVTVSDGFDSSVGETFTAKFDGAVQTVNAYDLICWIVNNEVSGSFSDEAIKAQAVAAYSYVKYHNVNGLTPSVLVKKNPSQRIKDMVSSVWGVCCYYNGSVAQTVYMASSSGFTADAKNVWGGSFPYLKSVACPFDAESDPNYGLKKRVSEADMKYYLESALGITLSDDPENWIKITAYIDGNYVSAINIDGQMTITGRKMRESVFGYDLKSTAFDVEYNDGVFTFTTYGYGHGVGMSQNGANILAKMGYSYSDILKYYFTGIEVL